MIVKNILKSNALLLALVTFLVSCQKNAEVIPQEPAVADEAAVVSACSVTPGTYTITNFVDDGRNATRVFNGWTFVYNSDGTVVATSRRGVIYNGTYVFRENCTEFVLRFPGAPNPLRELNEDWVIVSITDTQISLRDGRSRVTFTRQP